MKSKLIAAVLAVLAGQVLAQKKPDLAAGYRGVAVPFAGTELAFLKKGDYVDVYTIFDAQLKGGVKEKVAATILQYVLVLDVKQPEKLGDRGVVELAVNPNEGQYLALSYYQGELKLAIRAQGDKEMKPREMASFRKLFY